MIAAEHAPGASDGPVLFSDTDHSVYDGARRWPVVDDIPFVRVGREALADAALRALDAGDRIEALAHLLGDRAEGDRTLVPSRDVRRALGRDVRETTFRGALATLGFDDTGPTFGHRFGDPTFVAGLGLLAAHRPRGAIRSFEVACGAGHYLRELNRVGVAADGADIVFAKLWLARHYVAPNARLTCFDATRPWPIASARYDLVHLHDAMHAMEDKAFVAREMRRTARTSGTLALSHVRNVEVDPSPLGDSLDRAGYASLFPGAIVYDDRALAAAVVSGRVPRAGSDATLARVPAFAFVSGPTAPEPRTCDGDVAIPAPGTPLTRNPLYTAGGGTRVAWPSERYEREAAALATFPSVTGAPYRATMGSDPAIASFARTRELVALPERW